MGKPNWVSKIEERQLKQVGRPKKPENKIEIPFNFTQRKYQKDFWKQIQDEPIKRAVLVWHRRAGKDKTMFNALVVQAIRRVAVYYYIFPEFNLGRKALWDNLDKDGFRTIDHLPKDLRKRTDNQTMQLTLFNGSIIQIIGASDINRIVGTNPAGIVFSEYSIMSPSVVGYLLPIVSENDGFMWFNFTPRGDNHARLLWEEAQNDPAWFSQMVTAENSGVYSPDALEVVKKEYFKLYKDYNLFNQEMMCSFNTAVIGSYYGDHLAQAEAEGRFGSYPYISNEPVYTFWDIGVGDATAIWFAQFVKDRIYLIDYIEKVGKGIDYFIKLLQNKNYIYGDHYAPHDIKVREFGTGLSRLETAKKFGYNLKVSPKLNVADGINGVRMILSRCYFNTENEEVRMAVANLKNYHKKFNEERQTYEDTPYHDWSSHTADAIRYMAVNYNKRNNLDNSPTFYDTDIPDYAQVTNSGVYSPQTRLRTNPFNPTKESEVDMSLTTDVFNKDGWLR